MIKVDVKFHYALNGQLVHAQNNVHSCLSPLVRLQRYYRNLDILNLLLKFGKKLIKSNFTDVWSIAELIIH